MQAVTLANGDIQFRTVLLIVGFRAVPNNDLKADFIISDRNQDSE